MPNIFLAIALVMLIICALLYFAPHLKLLNFVDYGTGADVVRLNRYAAARLLLPLLVNVACSYFASAHPSLAIPLIFLTPISILVAVMWINVGAKDLNL